MDPSVLILNQNSSRCAAGKCDGLAGVLQRSLAIPCVQQRCDNRLPHNVSSVPDLVLVRTAVAATAKQLIASCKDKWTGASILALLCPERDRLIEDMSPVLSKIDDFVSCPFQEAELSL